MRDRKEDLRLLTGHQIIEMYVDDLIRPKKPKNKHWKARMKALCSLSK